MAGLLIKGGKVMYEDGSVVYTDDPAKCVCCGAEPKDDWLDDVDPDFPGPNGPGPGPDPDDPDCCTCDPATNLTRCRNCWDQSTDVDAISGELDIDKRVRVAGRVLATVRLFAERTNASGAVIATYDETFPIEVIIDSYPGSGGGFCSAQVDETDSTTITIGGNDFFYDYTIDFAWGTSDGFTVDGRFDMAIDDSDFVGGTAVTHSIEITGQSGFTTIDGVLSRATIGFPTGTPVATEDYTITMGTCKTRDTQSFGGIVADARSPATGHPALRAITEIQSLEIDVVVGNVIPCP